MHFHPEGPMYDWDLESQLQQRKVRTNIFPLTRTFQFQQQTVTESIRHVLLKTQFTFSNHKQNHNRKAYGENNK